MGSTLNAYDDTGKRPTPGFLTHHSNKREPLPPRIGTFSVLRGGLRRQASRGRGLDSAAKQRKDATEEKE